MVKILKTPNFKKISCFKSILKYMLVPLVPSGSVTSDNWFNLNTMCIIYHLIYVFQKDFDFSGFE